MRASKTTLQAMVILLLGTWALYPFSAGALNIYGVNTNYLTLESHTDPFEGATILGFSPLDPNSGLPSNLFGGTGGSEHDTVVFADGDPVGSVSFIQFHTSSPVLLISYRLFLADNYPPALGIRGITQFSLWSSPDSSYSTLSPISTANISSPYPTAYGSTIIAVEDAFPAVSSQYFLAKVVRATTYGPRLIELDANVVAAQLHAPTVQTLCSFNGGNGAFPQAALTMGNDGNFYGTTTFGGSNSAGTVFKVTTNGALTTLVSFNGYTNGAQPCAALTLGNDGNFYGTTETGEGISGIYGTVFKVTTNGTLSTLHTFTGGNDGGNPYAALTLGHDGNFYGTTEAGGAFEGGWGETLGTVFKVTTNGTLTTLVSFNGTNGAAPYAGLTLGSDGNFYGTTDESSGNAAGYGTVFRVTTNGTLTTLVSFNITNGESPLAALILGNDGYLYGTTYMGGSSGDGTVFRLSLPPPPSLTLQFLAGSPLLNMNGLVSNNFVVQYSTNLAGANWVNLLSLTNLSFSPYLFLDPAGVGQPERFYRAFMQ